MHLSICKSTLICHFLICQRVNSSHDTFSKYRILTNDDADNELSRFFNHFKTAYLEKHVPRHVMIVGGSNEDLRQVETLFKSYPYIICTEPETCVYRTRFTPGNFVFIFLDDLREETLKRNARILSRCGACKILYIFRGIIQKDGIRFLFTLTTIRNGAKTQFAHIEKSAVKFYTIYFSNNCAMEVRSIVAWTPEATFNVTDTWASGLRELNGCQVIVTTLDFAPKMLIKEYKNGSIIIAGGPEGKLVSAFAEKLNFTIAARYPALEDRLKYSRKTAILNDVATGKSEFGIGRMRPISNLYKDIAFSLSYDHECVTWAIPLVMTFADDILWMEFSCQVWVMVGLVFIACCLMGYACGKIDASKTGDRKEVGFAAIFLDVVAFHLGNPVFNVPASATGKLMLMICLCYAMVVNTAYKTSLASILTTMTGSPLIVDAEGIVEANLTVGGSSYNLEFLKDQVNESKTISKLIERFTVINNNSEVIRRLKFDDKFACISRGSALLYERQKILTAQKPLTFDVFKNCVLDHQTVMIFRKESFLREQADKLIRRLGESGILSYWARNELNPDRRSRRKPIVEGYFDSSDKSKFLNIFIFYSGCIAVSFFTFLIELATSMHISRAGNHTSNS